MSNTLRAARLDHDEMLARMYASDAASDGRFLTGVLTTGIYCLPSCRARKPKSENVRFFATVGAAREAGLRPCRRCRPDDFYAGHDPDGALAAGVAERIRRDPAKIAGVDDMARIAGTGATRLHGLFQRHFHTTPAAFLTRARIDAARKLLADGAGGVNDCGYAVGFEAISTFYDQFRRSTGLTPGEYRRLGERRTFRLRLPDDYSPRWALRVLARQPANAAEGVHGTSAYKVLLLPDGVGVLRLDFGPGSASCSVDAGHALSPPSIYLAHEAALRLLGLTADPAAFERRMVERGDAALISDRTGLRVPRTANVWEALVWAILGQQVNLAYACAMRRDLVALCGEPAGHGGMRAHPTPAAIAALDTADLRRLRFSGRKAEYLIELARTVENGTLSLAQLEDADASDAGARMLALRGIGPWTARYVMMRGLGFADVAPIGDAALALALQRYFSLDQRPSAAEADALMQRFAPFRSLATFHLWQSLVVTE